MDYRLTIAKGEDIIFDKVVDADTVIELMRPTVAQGGVRSESSSTEEVRTPRAPKPAKEPKQKGRKSALTEEVLERARKMIANGMSYGDAAEKLGVGKSSLYTAIPKSSLPKA